MGLKCANCSKGIMYGHNVSHAKNRTRKLFKPNLHVTKINIGGVSRRVRLCTKCLRMYKRAQQAVAVSQKTDKATVAAV